MAGPRERAGFMLPPENRAWSGRSHQTFFWGILNITKRVRRFGSAHPQQHSGGVGKPDGQVSRFRVLPPSLLLHREDGEHHLEGAQHLNGQSLSRIQLQGHLWGRGAGECAEGRGAGSSVQVFGSEASELTLLTKCSAAVLRGRAK